MKPEPPTNVRVVLDDGTEVPVQCQLAGRRADGNTAVWKIVDLPELKGRRVVGMNADRVPGHSAIELPLEGWR